jgi:hypothetical protein
MDTTASDGAKADTAAAASAMDTDAPASTEPAPRPLTAAALASHLDPLLVLEKQCRLGNDAASTTAVALACVELCLAAGDLERLRDTIGLLARRRGQGKAAVGAMVERGVRAVDEIGCGAVYPPLGEVRVFFFFFFFFFSLSVFFLLPFCLPIHNCIPHPRQKKQKKHTHTHIHTQTRSLMLPGSRSG